MNKNEKEFPETPKHAKTVMIINIAVVSAFFVAGIMFLIFGERSSDPSEYENRELSKPPKFSLSELFSGRYTGGLSQFVNDNVPFRDKITEYIADIKSLRGVGYGGDSVKMYTPGGKNNDKDTAKDEKPAVTKLPDPVAVSGGDAAESAGENPVIPEPGVPEPAVPEPLEIPDDDGVITDGILVVGNRGFSIYYGSEVSAAKYVQYLNSYKRDLGDSVNVYSVISTTQQTYYMPPKYSKDYGHEPTKIDALSESFEGVVKVDVHKALLPHAGEDIFFRTDHHWAPLGAYYAAEEFAKTAGVPFAGLDKYERVDKTGFVGSFFSFTKESVFKNEPDDFTYYKPTNNYTTTYYSNYFTSPSESRLFFETLSGGNLYGTFVGTDEVAVHINTDVKNGRTLCIIKDSYGNAFLPFMVNSFENIYMLDMRYFELNAVDFMKEKGVTDVAFVMNSFSATGINYSHLERLRTL